MSEVIEGHLIPPRRPAATPDARAPETDVRSLRYERIALVDLLDRLLAGGVVITGEVRLAIADVDLVNVSLRALISSVSTVLEHGGPAAGQGLEDGA
jgi:hypothetical protein